MKVTYYVILTVLCVALLAANPASAELKPEEGLAVDAPLHRDVRDDSPPAAAQTPEEAEPVKMWEQYLASQSAGGDPAGKATRGILLENFKKFLKVASKVANAILNVLAKK